MPSRTERLQVALEGRYRVERELGSGGMATVYLAEDLKHHRKVAVKVLREDLAATLGPERFLREIEVAAQLTHPHILPLHDSGEADGFLYYVMPYISGESLRTRLERDRELPVGEAVRILRDVADALASAHRHGVVHRDVKPDNVLLSENHAVVTDFGVAKAVSEATGRQTLTTAGVALGTPAYMAPEQAAADPQLDHRVDIYAVGAMAYELLTGRPPFAGLTPQMMLAAHITETPRPITDHRAAVPPVLANLVMRCLQKKPADRWQLADDVLRQLELVMTPSGGITPAETRPVAAVTRARRPRAGMLVAGAALVSVLAVGTWLVARGGAGHSTAAASGDDSVPSVAVIPFIDRSPQPGGEYFVDGLTEEIIGALSRVPGLRVPGSASSFFFKGSGTELSAIADSLRVRTLLTGSVQRDSQRVRIRVELVNASDQFQVWAETYQRTMDDVFAVYDDVARAIAGALRLRLASRRGGARTKTTTAPGAYDAYLLGKYHLDRRRIDSALAYLERAVTLDSGFVLAWSALADAHSLSTPANYALPGVTGASGLAAAEAAARHAVALDSTSANAQLSLAYVNQLQFHWTDAEREYRTALSLDPNNAHLRHWFASLLLTRGQRAAALAQIRRAHELDPLSLIIGVWEGWIAWQAGERNQAIRTFQGLRRLFPSSERVRRDAAVVFLRAGDLATAADAAAEWFEGRGAPPTFVRRIRDGVRKRDRRVLVLVADSTGIPDPLLVAGDTARYLRGLRQTAVVPGELGITAFIGYSLDLEMQKRPEFQRILREAGLEPTR